MIKALAKIVIALNGNISKTQIAAGFAWGVLLGLVPAGVFWAALLIVSFCFLHNHGGKLIAMALVKIFRFALYPLTDEVGWRVLNLPSLRDFWTGLYNTPFVPFTHFNNTLVMGGIVSGVVLWLPVFLAAMIIVPIYRRTLLPKLMNTKIVKAIGKTPLVSKITGAVTTIQNIKDADIF